MHLSSLDTSETSDFVQRVADQARRRGFESEARSLLDLHMKCLAGLADISLIVAQSLLAKMLRPAQNTKPQQPASNTEMTSEAT